MPINARKEELIKKYTDMIKKDYVTSAQNVSIQIFDALQAYQKEYKETIEEGNALNNQDFPMLWEVMFALKNRVAEMTFEESELVHNGSDFSNFIKAYLNDPVDAILNQKDFLVENYDRKDGFLYKGLYPDDYNLEEAKRNDLLLKEKVGEIKNNYYTYAETKKDLWKEDQQLNVDWFKHYFKNEDKNVDEILASHKGGFFENLFGTTSEEYKYFSKAFKDFLTDTPDKGNIRRLRQCALNYLDHKLPSFKMYNQEFDQRDINKLDSTGKGRVKLCLDTIAALDKACDAMDEELDLNDQKEIKIVDIQADFQNLVKDDVENNLDKGFIEDNQSDLENNNIISNDELDNE